MLNWLLKKLIARERKRQINVLGYDSAHDINALTRDSGHLINEAYAHYRYGRLIAALALLEAQSDADRAMWPDRRGRVYTRVTAQ